MRSAEQVVTGDVPDEGLQKVWCIYLSDVVDGLTGLLCHRGGKRATGRTTSLLQDKKE
jgi:hypothetical protein